MEIKANKVADYVGLQGNFTLTGKIVRVHDKKSGTSEKGDWSFQNFVVADETGEMQVVLKNRPEELSAQDQGKAFSASSQETKNGILGVKVEKEEYKTKEGKDTSAIKVIITKAGKIDLGEPVTPVPQQHAPTTNTATKATETQTPKTDLKQLRKETILEAVAIWREALKEELGDPTNPAYPEIITAMIAAAGKNADTALMSETGRR